MSSAAKEKVDLKHADTISTITSMDIVRSEVASHHEDEVTINKINKI